MLNLHLLKNILWIIGKRLFPGSSSYLKPLYLSMGLPSSLCLVPFIFLIANCASAWADSGISALLSEERFTAIAQRIDVPNIPPQDIPRSLPPNPQPEQTPLQLPSPEDLLPKPTTGQPPPELPGDTFNTERNAGGR